MKKLTSLGLIVLSIICSVGHAATITVTTTASSGAGSLDAAIKALSNGDTIEFNIAGAGPHYLEPPNGGWPLITNDNVTINGYSQPGSAPNSNPILAANNAQIKIVLSSTNSVVNELYTPLDYNSGTNVQTGFGSTDFAVLGVYGANNVTIKGLSLIGTPGAGVASHYGIALMRDTTHPCNGAHINGCWIGVEPSGVPTRVREPDPDNHPGVFVTNLWDFKDCIVAASHRSEFSYRFRGTNAGCVFDVTLTNRD